MLVEPRDHCGARLLDVQGLGVCDFFRALKMHAFRKGLFVLCNQGLAARDVLDALLVHCFVHENLVDFDARGDGAEQGLASLDLAVRGQNFAVCNRCFQPLLCGLGAKMVRKCAEHDAAREKPAEQRLNAHNCPSEAHCVDRFCWRDLADDIFFLLLFVLVLERRRRQLLLEAFSREKPARRCLDLHCGVSAFNQRFQRWIRGEHFAFCAVFPHWTVSGICCIVIVVVVVLFNRYQWNKLICSIQWLCANFGIYRIPHNGKRKRPRKRPIWRLCNTHRIPTKRKTIGNHKADHCRRGKIHIHRMSVLEMFENIIVFL
eukprot:comp10208_c0_seq1/m.12231 comp10208_c0_seq1/g.12231  ORF comp10208_c0_seq1/g.12231 comp10208_c0_seq1/m.12231 type:complete len:317 (+) comp10208_c0_seq1:539-1489(+)